MSVHYIAVLRMMVGCEVASVLAMTSHVDMPLPPPDTIYLYCKLRRIETTYLSYRDGRLDMWQGGFILDMSVHYIAVLRMVV
nr:NAD(P)-binding Rossmann-fold superfamily protein [Tanacetum cinerariifolium]